MKIILPWCLHCTSRNVATVTLLDGTPMCHTWERATTCVRALWVILNRCCEEVRDELEAVPLELWAEFWIYDMVRVGADKVDLYDHVYDGECPFHGYGAPNDTLWDVGMLSFNFARRRWPGTMKGAIKEAKVFLPEQDRNEAYMEYVAKKVLNALGAMSLEPIWAG